MIGRILGQIIALGAVCLVPAAIISLGHGEWYAAGAIAITFAAMALVASSLWYLCRKAKRAFGATEGMVCTGLAWLILSLLG